MNQLLLDGDLIPEKDFDKEFIKIVGCAWKEWIKIPTTKSDGGGEWYEWRDNNFVLCGSAYNNPKLYKIN